MNKTTTLLLLFSVLTVTSALAYWQPFDGKTIIRCVNGYCNVTSETSQLYWFNSSNTTIDNTYYLTINRSIPDCVNNTQCVYQNTSCDEIKGVCGSVIYNMSSALVGMQNSCNGIINSFNSSLGYYALYANCYANLTRYSNYDQILANSKSFEAEKNSCNQQLTNYNTQVQTLTTDKNKCTTDLTNEKNNKFIYGAIGAAAAFGIAWYMWKRTPTGKTPQQMGGIPPGQF